MTRPLNAALQAAAAALMITQTAGCAYGSRLKALEAELDTLKAQLETEAELPDYELRLQSSNVAIEKNRERLDAIVPPDAQWMPLSFGASLKWYVDTDIDAVYVQFLSMDAEEAAVQVNLSTVARQTSHRMRPGESFEHRLDDLNPPRSVVLTLHRVQHDNAGGGQGLFSLVAVD